MKQHTIKESVSVYGVGLHTGRPATLTFHPAPVNHGFRFRRIDLEGQPVIPADINYVTSTNRGTTLSLGKEVSVATVEHTLAALVGLGIDNALIDLDGPEAPILDGSSAHFSELLTQAGVVEQDAEREYLIIREPVTYTDEDTGSELIALPADHFEVTALIDFNSPVLGQQFAALDDIRSFKEEIAPARTFVFVHELEQLIEQGLIKGGDLDNAIVIADRIFGAEELERLAHKLGKRAITIDREGVLNTTELRFKNEPARHKLLDVIGDLALLGVPIKGKIVARKPGHSVNRAFTRLLKKQLLEQRKLKGRPHYDPDAPPVLDHAAILRKLPHRFPFLLVDKIIELSDEHVVGVKCVTFNEPFFPGHFPGNPIMPGVLQIEAMAQTGGILALKNVPEDEQWDTYFLKVDNARFKTFVVPGDTLIMKLELIAPIRRGIVHMQAIAYVGNKIVAEAELTAQIVKRNS
jgi:UDP-3-O-[3-hydroxymyristoyl] N-acetylglucosamine deacetylase/3-hydroxyacyl-[acyl-carrier-protein] dehydratase